METTLKFKTNINCDGCVATVTPILDEAQGICHWDVDLEDENKLLTIHSTGVTSEEIIRRIGEVGFKAEEITK